MNKFKFSFLFLFSLQSFSQDDLIGDVSVAGKCVILLKLRYQISKARLPKEIPEEKILIISRYEGLARYINEQIGY
ncbi:MAG: hypothetical protein GDA46_04565 [Bdellovibrionales bacterium]|nr:hypothetical protein [Bdellovibrionales bacterium]